MQALKALPMSVLYGVFLYMGITALNGNQFWERILMLFMQPSKYPKRVYTDRVKRSDIHKWTYIELFLFVLLYVVKTIKSIAIAFPLIIAACIPIRIWLLPKIFDADTITLMDGDDSEIAAMLDKKKDGDATTSSTTSSGEVAVTVNQA